jgi:hypothetical protein
MLSLATIVTVSSAASLAAGDTYVAREGAQVVHTDGYADHRSVQMDGYAGVGYGVGVGGRLGTTLDPGLYLGGAFTYYTENASFLGGEVGYKLWPGYRWELRPYLFMGPAFVRVGDLGFGRRPGQPDVVLGFQPGFLAAYHFGATYLLVDGRAYASPNPGALAVFGGFGVNL